MGGVVLVSQIGLLFIYAIVILIVLILLGRISYYLKRIHKLIEEEVMRSADREKQAKLENYKREQYEKEEEIKRQEAQRIVREGIEKMQNK
ncbi:MAG: hypothetical protein KKB20_08825 [Proteobacteria bacterium]|nr:hypothetical protein [Pseudomonadota bacterium]